MRKPLMLLAILGAGGGSASADSSIPNPKIDMAAYLKVAQEAAAHRETHRVTEAEFMRMIASRAPSSSTRAAAKNTICCTSTAPST